MLKQQIILSQSDLMFVMLHKKGPKKETSYIRVKGQIQIKGHAKIPLTK